ncbi:hypothetical protein HDC90_000072 [Pedobacter sp. AK013]|uniref:hypothetical protein n=1 Tax=Pedobacter sp. AK013 TaxID=2723071 RepID=UPI001615B885|nr:hypothetical protein [Pedobacter sp. AK013]MBB6235475.1 hypothetical protein [Pedobacter sp. AK013]
MKKIFLYIFIVLIFDFTRSYAQSGCLIPANNTVYTVQDNQGIINAVLAIVFGGNPVYQANPNEPSISTCIANSQKVWVATAQNCTVCPLGYSFNILGVVTGCQTTTYVGNVANATIVQCNIDDHTWIFGAAAGLFGIFIIRKRNKP